MTSNTAPPTLVMAILALSLGQLWVGSGLTLGRLWATLGQRWVVKLLGVLLKLPSLKASITECLACCELIAKLVALHLKIKWITRGGGGSRASERLRGGMQLLDGAITHKGGG